LQAYNCKKSLPQVQIQPACVDAGQVLQQQYNPVPESNDCAEPHLGKESTTSSRSAIAKVVAGHRRQKAQRPADRLQSPSAPAVHAGCPTIGFPVAVRGAFSVVLFATILAGCSGFFSTTRGDEEAVESDVTLRQAAPAP